MNKKQIKQQLTKIKNEIDSTFGPNEFARIETTGGDTYEWRGKTHTNPERLDLTIQNRSDELFQPDPHIYDDDFPKFVGHTAINEIAKRHLKNVPFEIVESEKFYFDIRVTLA